MESRTDGTERRKFKRIVFSAQDEVMGAVAFPEHAGKSFTCKIADIGAGGLRFIIAKDDAPKALAVDSTLLLHEIKGRSPLEIVGDVELQVRWVMEHEMLDHLAFGCEFVRITEDLRAQIDRFVESELARLDQES